MCTLSVNENKNYTVSEKGDTTVHNFTK